eukprot:m.81968 g.81968  ORF g.81968 m.81968 type:complete len:343 (-) comp12664_c0_seq1:1372-2400(-)
MSLSSKATTTALTCATDEGHEDKAHVSSAQGRTAMLSTAKPLTGLLSRAWRDVACAATAPSVAASPMEIRVMQFNVLADGLAQNGGFIFTRSEDLEWSSRFPLLLKQISAADPDLLVMEECNNAPEWDVALSGMGYHCIFSPKQKSPALRFGASADGSALCFKKTTFTLEGSATIPSPTAVAAQLVHNQSQKAFRVIGTHLKAKLEFTHIRTSQIKTLMEFEWQSIAGLTSTHLHAEPAASIPCLFMGDMNCGFEESSFDQVRAIGYKQLTNADMYPWTTFKYRGSLETPKIQKYIGDHILGNGPWSVRRYLALPDEIPEQGLPCTRYPSDHMAVACVIALD